MRFLQCIFLIVIVLVVGGCQQLEQRSLDEKSVEDVSEIRKQEEKAEKVIYREATIEIGAIGDVLLHERVYEHAKVGEGKYDFLPMLEEVSDLLKAPDFLMANMESIPGGVEIGLSTYPSFNSPQEIVTDLQSLGVDMVIGANNHTLDRGVRAIENAINFYDEIGMPYVGKYRDTEDRKTDRIVKIGDITMGILAYTYGTNGIPIPKGHEDVVALIEPERIVNDVQRLREKVDIVVVHMHWGAEYIREPNKEQRQLALTLADAGVDIIFGHHPHVLQPIEMIEGENGKKTVVFYSLGNFYSGQNFEYTDIGGVASVKVTKIVEGDETEVTVHSPKIDPTLVVRKENGYFMKPMSEADSQSISGTTFEEIIEHTNLYLSQ